jgi:hypothetical protein
MVEIQGGRYAAVRGAKVIFLSAYHYSPLNEKKLPPTF